MISYEKPSCRSASVRSATIIADANGGWTLQDAMVVARLIAPLPRVFLEQACASIDECLYVRQHTDLPMVLDEIIHDVPSLLRAFTARGMEAFNLKISKVGGLTQARLMRDIAVALGLRVTIEDTWGGDITTAAVSHLAASTRPDTSCSLWTAATPFASVLVTQRSPRRVSISTALRRPKPPDAAPIRSFT